MNKEQIGTVVKISDLLFSDGVVSGLLSIKEETRREIGRAWSNLGAQMRDSSASYRFVNYLDGLGLLPDHRIEGGRGWRRFSYVDMIYLELVLALRRAKVKTSVIKSIYQTFSVPYLEDGVSYGRIGWLDLLLVVHYGIEMELLISLESSEAVFCDPAVMVLLGTGATDGQIRISLSKIINNVREKYNLDPIKIKQHFGQLGLDEGEFETIFAVQNLRNESEEVRVHKTTDGRLLVDTKRTNDDEEFKKDIEKIIRKYDISDYTDLSLAIRQGGVAHVRQMDSKIFEK